jgi:hypothetical protein
MARTEDTFGQRRRQPSAALTLVGMVLGAATLGFTTAGLWYQFCLDQGDYEAAATFADLAPPPEIVLLAGLGLIVTVGLQLDSLLRRAHAGDGPPRAQSSRNGEFSVFPRRVPPVAVSDPAALTSSREAVETG